MYSHLYAVLIAYVSMCYNVYAGDEEGVLYLAQKSIRSWASFRTKCRIDMLSIWNTSHECIIISLRRVAY